MLRWPFSDQKITEWTDSQFQLYINTMGTIVNQEYEIAIILLLAKVDSVEENQLNLLYNDCFYIFVQKYAYL